MLTFESLRQDISALEGGRLWQVSIYVNHLVDLFRSLGCPIHFFQLDVSMFEELVSDDSCEHLLLRCVEWPFCDRRKLSFSLGLEVVACELRATIVFPSSVFDHCVHCFLAKLAASVLY